MKKKYIAPKSECVELTSEALMIKTASITINPGKDTTDNFSMKQGWSCEDWSTEEDESDENK